MPVRYSKSYESFHKAVHSLGDLKKNKKQFMELLQLWHMDHPLVVDDAPKEKEKSKKKKKKDPKACDDEDGEPSARKKVSIAEPDSGKKAKAKKQTAKK